MPKLRRTTTTHVAVLRELEVVRVEDVTPGMRRLTLAGADLAERSLDGSTLPAFASPGFDDHVKVFVPAPDAERPVLPRQRPDGLDYTTEGVRPLGKDYTPRRVTSDEVDLDFVRHGHGQAAGWAEQVRAGDLAWIAGPTVGQAFPHDVDAFVLAGDETALPAIGRFLEELPAGPPAQVVVEVSGPQDEQDLTVRDGVEVTWLHRPAGAEPGTTTLLLDAVRDLDWPAGQVYAWMAGESTAARDVRTHWRADRSVPRDCLDVSGYWRR
ncbi:siderophore-interacting protein [Aeromicrobium sp.]|uniref:siderophore-interacting protein n=1 Tax=Aeromicrobium sp. TaxID=1871063 RepID=UPI003518F905